MRHERQLEILDRLLGYVEARSTQFADEEARVPVSYYTSPERLAEESRVHAGADTAFRIGRPEHPIRLFHDAVDRALAAHAPGLPGGHGGSTGERPSPAAASPEAAGERVRSGT